MANLKKLHGMKFLKLLNQKFENSSKEKICGFVGDLTNMETGYIFKEFFDRTLSNHNYDSRSDNRYVDVKEREIIYSTPL